MRTKDRHSHPYSAPPSGPTLHAYDCDQQHHHQQQHHSLPFQEREYPKRYEPRDTKKHREHRPIDPPQPPPPEMKESTTMNSGTSKSKTTLDGISLIQRGNEYFFSDCYLEATGYYYQAAMILKEDNGSTAVPSENRALERSKAWSNVAECHLRLSNWHPAEEAATSAIQADPKNAKALYRRAKARFELGNYAGAAADAQAVGTQEARDVAALCHELAHTAALEEEAREEPNDDYRRDDTNNNNVDDNSRHNHGSPRTRHREREPQPAVVGGGGGGGGGGIEEDVATAAAVRSRPAHRQCHASGLRVQPPPPPQQQQQQEGRVEHREEYAGYEVIHHPAPSPMTPPRQQQQQSRTHGRSFSSESHTYEPQYHQKAFEEREQTKHSKTHDRSSSSDNNRYQKQQHQKPQYQQQGQEQEHYHQSKEPRGNKASLFNDHPSYEEDHHHHERDQQEQHLKHQQSRMPRDGFYSSKYHHQRELQHQQQEHQPQNMTRDKSSFVDNYSDEEYHYQRDPHGQKRQHSVSRDRSSSSSSSSDINHRYVHQYQQEQKQQTVHQYQQPQEEAHNPPPKPPVAKVVGERELWMRRIVDSYRLRVDDEYTKTGASDASCLYGIRAKGQSITPMKHFRAYVQRALKKRVLPEWFTVPDMDELCHLAMHDPFSNLMLAVVPEEIEDYYTNELGVTEELELLRDMALYIEGPIGMPWKEESIVGPASDTGNHHRQWQQQQPTSPIRVVPEPPIGNTPSRQSRTRDANPFDTKKYISADHTRTTGSSHRYKADVSRDVFRHGHRYDPTIPERAQSYDHCHRNPQIQQRYSQSQDRYSEPAQRGSHQHDHKTASTPRTNPNGSSGRLPYAPISTVAKVTAPPEIVRSGSSNRPPWGSVNIVEKHSSSEYPSYETELRRHGSRLSRSSQQKQEQYDYEHLHQNSALSTQPENPGNPRSNPGLMLPHAVAPKKSHPRHDLMFPEDKEKRIPPPAAPSADDTGSAGSESYGPQQLHYRQEPVPILPGDRYKQMKGKTKSLTQKYAFSNTTTRAQSDIRREFFREEARPEKMLRNGLSNDEQDVFSELTELSP